MPGHLLRQAAHALQAGRVAQHLVGLGRRAEVGSAAAPAPGRHGRALNEPQATSEQRASLGAPGLVPGAALTSPRTRSEQACLVKRGVRQWPCARALATEAAPGHKQACREGGRAAHQRVPPRLLRIGRGLQRRRARLARAPPRRACAEHSDCAPAMHSGH